MAEKKKLTKLSKGIFAAGAVLFAVLWLALWLIFPMEWYSLFFASTVGSFVTIALLAADITIILCWAFSILSGIDIPFSKNLIVNIFFMAAVLWLFAAFRYSMPYVVIIAAVLHAAAMVWVMGFAYKYPKKGKSDPENVKAIKKQPIITVIWAAAYVISADILNIFLFSQMAYIFSES